MLNELTNVIFTLNQVEVHGENNLKMLLGCIQTLKEALENAANDERGA